MFFAGVTFGKGDTSSAIVIVRMRRIQVRRHYFIESAQRVPSNETGDAIATIHHGAKYSFRKRVFSQNRRPAKTVFAKPVIVAEFSEDTSQIDSLRTLGIPVEGISVRDGPGWRKEDFARAGFGNNYFVSGDDLVGNLRLLLHEKRLAIDCETALPEELATGLERIRDGGKRPGGDMLLALAMPLWFRETIRIVKRY